jgi:hypothetical protein
VRWIGIAALAAGLATAAQAHKASDSYLTLDIDGAHVRGSWDISLRDLELAIGLDANSDGKITWGEVKTARERIGRYLLPRLSLGDGSKTCPLRAGELLADRHSDGAYAVLRFDASCDAAPAGLDITYTLLFDEDQLHRGLVRVRAGGVERAVVFSPDARRQRVQLSDSGWAGIPTFLRAGIAHIWAGIDHLLFLVALLLPAVLRRENGKWRPVSSFGSALRRTLLVVSTFTLAHSVTLSLAAFGAVRLPSRWVESAIALSVLLAAVNNLIPIFRGRPWVFSFGFGLVHGLGLANVLTDLGLPKASLLRALLAFNAGVEIGQLAIVAVALAVAYAVRRTWAYERLGLVAGSIAIALVSIGWFVQRAFQVSVAFF